MWAGSARKKGAGMLVGWGQGCSGGVGHELSLRDGFLRNRKG